CVLSHSVPPYPPMVILLLLGFAPSLGRGLEEQVRRGRAGILVPGASLAEVARAALPRYERDRVLHALLGGGRRLLERVREGRTTVERGLEPVPAGDKGVDHCLVARLRLAASLDAGDPGLQGGGPVVRTQLAFAGSCRPHLEKQRSVERSAGAADGRHERHADRLQQGADVL